MDEGGDAEVSPRLADRDQGLEFFEVATSPPAGMLPHGRGEPAPPTRRTTMHQLSEAVFVLGCVFVGIACHEQSRRDLDHAIAVIDQTLSGDVANIATWHACLDRAQAWKRQAQAHPDVADTHEARIKAALDDIRLAVSEADFDRRVADFDTRLTAASVELPQQR